MLGLWSIRKTVGAPGPVDGALEWPRPEEAGLAMKAHNTLMLHTATAPPTGRAYALDISIPDGLQTAVLC